MRDEGEDQFIEEINREHPNRWLNDLNKNHNKFMQEYYGNLYPKEFAEKLINGDDSA